MNNSKSVSRIIIILSILIIPSIGYLIVSSGDNKFSRLEIFGPKDPSPENPKDTIYHTIAPFELDAHDGSKFSSKQLDGKIYVADFFFATCQSICPKMSMQLKRVQEVYKDDPEIMLVSHTVNPAQDSVAALAAYAKEYGAIPGKWYFLTGDKSQIYNLALKSYFIAASETIGGPEAFVHSEKLILIDKDKRIRGFYDGTDYESVNLLIDEIVVLKYEYSHKE